MIIVTLCAGAALLDTFLGLWDGILLFTGLVIFLFRLAVVHLRSSSMELAAEISELEEVLDT